MKIKNLFQLGGLSLLLLFSSCQEESQEPKNTTPPNSRPQPQAPASTPSSSVPEGYHKVKAGESLFDVAKKYDLSVSKLKDLNPKLADDPTSWNVGLEVRIKEEEKSVSKQNPPSSPASSPAASPSTSDSKSGWIYHKLEKGETLYRVAKKNDLTMKQLYLLNPSLKGKESNLKVGQRVRVY